MGSRGDWKGSIGGLLLRFCERVMDRGVRQDHRDRVRLLTLVGVSLALHALVFWALAQLEPAELRRNKPVEMELAWVEPEVERAPEPQQQVAPQVVKTTPTPTQK